MSRAVDEHVGRVEVVQVRRLLRPAERGERPERRREPRVEHVLVLASRSCCRTSRRLRSRSWRAVIFAAVVALPDRNPVAPPELAGDAPVADVLHPVEVDALVAFRDELDLPSSTTSIAGCGELLHPQNHCSREQRLDDRAAALARADGVRVVLDLLDQPLRPAGPRPRASRASNRSRPSYRAPASWVIVPSGPITITCGRLCRRPISKSFGSCAGRDLHRAGAELHDPRTRRR